MKALERGIRITAAGQQHRKRETMAQPETTAATADRDKSRKVVYEANIFFNVFSDNNF